MSKITWTVSMLASLALALVTNWIANLLGQHIDPQDVVGRSLLYIVLGIVYLVAYAWTSRADLNPGNPRYSQSPDDSDTNSVGVGNSRATNHTDGSDNSDSAMWGEAIMNVAASMILFLTLCVSMANPERLNMGELLMSMGALAGMITGVWPSVRRRQYAEMENWVMAQLELDGRVRVSSLLHHFAATPDAVNARQPLNETAKGRQYLAYLHWLVLNYMGQIAVENGWIVRRPRERPATWPPPRAGGPSEHRPLVRA